MYSVKDVQQKGETVGRQTQKAKRGGEREEAAEALSDALRIKPMGIWVRVFGDATKATATRCHEEDARKVEPKVHAAARMAGLDLR